MKNVLASPKAYLLAGLLVIVVTASAWQLKDKKHPRDTAAVNNTADTARPGKHDIDADDYGMKGFAEGMRQLDLNLKNLNVNLTGLDTIINESVRKALANVDFSKIGSDVQNAVNSIDWNEINNTISNSMKTAEGALKSVDMDKVMKDVQRSLDNVKNIDMHFDSQGLEKTINDAVNNAMGSIGKMNWAVQDWKDLTNDLEKDGLIDLKKGYKIEWKDNGELYINGAKQPKDVTDKYHKYFKQGGFTLKSNGDETESL